MRIESLERLVEYMNRYAYWKQRGKAWSKERFMSHYVNLICIEMGETVPDSEELKRVLADLDSLEVEK